MNEIELKFAVKSFTGVREKLRKMRARLIWKGAEENFFFDTFRGDLRRKKMNLRLRRWAGHSNTLTLKAPAKSGTKKYKVRNEYQIEINDLRIAAEILQKLGFVEVLHYKKSREHWQFGGAYIELDMVGGEKFVEIESSKKGIDKFAKLFGLDFKKSTTEGYLAILNRLGSKDARVVYN